ncbi:hypothetical protein Pmar_PMAR026964 [Perkinsus marinus ATCC 50983]|uniref:Uncharacterized protein n=1 Tax=Perkinsus marinus (strain ATCC 50983 / TXsc) TaxID=423536 RepID=C5LE84_PERM5|nr:hypothetical protein Pmar_PMAR026964 [Perkinsus marinus ATCC 50983]EER04952.1 hypothetical protein Pmar_PMAR026964 [Perkinsus marinus ATCC 50983]|eukprot:XP_002773136.1 hypothetical protein Pmar_PMAR026964 [Perkinsus marinus ATCC 50983]
MIKLKVGLEGERWFGVKINKNVSGRMPRDMRPVISQIFTSTKDKVRNGKFRKDPKSGCIDIETAFDECEVHFRSEQRAKETFKKHFDALTDRYKKKLMASGETPEKAASSAQKYAALQLKQTKGKQFQILWKNKTMENIKKGMHPSFG